MAALNAFKQAFPQADKSVGLVLKTMNTDPNNPQWQTFLNECKADKRIYVLTETMDRPEVLGLIDCCDAYLSLHRAEGFGRTIAEVILLGKPVIVSNYSVNIDFSKSNNFIYFVDIELVEISFSDYFWIGKGDKPIWAEPIISNGSLIMRSKYNLKAPKFSYEYFNASSISEVIKLRLNAVKF